VTETENSSTSENRGNLDAPTLKWEDTISALRKTRLTVPKTVALCGFALSSRHLAPYDKRSVEIWGCNEAYNADYMKTKGGLFRADRWFQMHTEEDWGRNNNPNDLRHPEWLGLEHNFPIVMQDKFAVVPNAESFPLKEADEMFFSNVWTVDLRTGKRRKWLDIYKHGYYTSTFAWMLAYALWQRKWEMVEVWGFNMGTQSEYMYQKPGAEFWVGQAMALGVGLAIADNSPLLKGKLYGYEIANVLLPSHLLARKEEIQKELLPLKDKAMQQHGARQMIEHLQTKPEFVTQAVELQKQVEIQHQAELASTATVNFYLGANHLIEMYLLNVHTRHGDGKTGFIDRLTLEVQKVKYLDEVEEARTYMDAVAGAKMEVYRNLELYTQDPEAIASWKNRLRALRNKEIYWTGILSLAMGRLSQVQQFIFVSENRNANMIDERDYSTVIVPDLYARDSDVLKLGEKKNDTQKTEPIATPDISGTGGNPSKSSQSA